MRQAQRRAVLARRPTLQAVDGVRGQVPGQPARVERFPVGQPQPDGARRRSGAVGRAAASARIAEGVAANTSRTVSLNCRMLAKPAAKATSDIGRSVVSISSPGGLGALRPGEGERSGAELGDAAAGAAAASE